jgi:hypothetical protein
MVRRGQLEKLSPREERRTTRVTKRQRDAESFKAEVADEGATRAAPERRRTAAAEREADADAALAGELQEVPEQQPGQPATEVARAEAGEEADLWTPRESSEALWARAMEAGSAVAEAAAEHILARPLFSQSQQIGNLDGASVAGSHASRLAAKAKKPLAPDKWQQELQATKEALAVAAASSPFSMRSSIFAALKDPAVLEDWFLENSEKIGEQGLPDDIIRSLARLAMGATAFVAWRGLGPQPGQSQGTTEAPAARREEVAPQPVQALPPQAVSVVARSSKSSVLSQVLNGFLVVRGAPFFTLSKASPHHRAMLRVLSDAHEACAGQRLCWALVSLAQEDARSGEYDECSRKLKAFAQSDSQLLSIDGLPRHQILSLLAGMIAGVVARDRELSQTDLPLAWPLRVVAAAAQKMISANTPIQEGLLDEKLIRQSVVPAYWSDRLLTAEPLAAFWSMDVSTLNAAKADDSKRLTKLWQTQADVLAARVTPGGQERARSRSRTRSRSRSRSRSRRRPPHRDHARKEKRRSSSEGSSSESTSVSRGGSRGGRRRESRPSSGPGREKGEAGQGVRGTGPRPSAGGAGRVETTAARRKYAAFLAAGPPPTGGLKHELKMCPDGRARWFPWNK